MLGGVDGVLGMMELDTTDGAAAIDVSEPTKVGGAIALARDPRNRSPEASKVCSVDFVIVSIFSRVSRPPCDVM